MILKNNTNCNNCIGCIDCNNCSDLVGRRYCIDNIQYTKDEYYKKVNL